MYLHIQVINNPPLLVYVVTVCPLKVGVKPNWTNARKYFSEEEEEEEEYEEEEEEEAKEAALEYGLIFNQFPFLGPSIDDKGSVRGVQVVKLSPRFLKKANLYP